jgi:GTP-binding protein HflX
MIGKGKVNEIAEYVNDNKIALVIFENELAFTQIRNLEQKIKCKIMDKSNLILRYLCIECADFTGKAAGGTCAA